ncbi:NlpC/P60 family protein [Tamlana sp. 2_MG-2023]|uniref:C40 family peptidase n=1 Tax=unclassified Tamlana TaxID=2614803 RepID=UPI0026E4904A|nr:MULTISPECIES: NlpC/P60 family protein [unclassified Tamlana]MDO6759141.1 NlpC/P60 family protein [Tamlana sp. 2_MG-2023]MDO6789840.1 NlpC/P60 family protein [Tamlana sp. 1_MG-2023]
MKRNLYKLGPVFLIAFTLMYCKGSKVTTNNDDIVVSYDTITPKKAFLPVQIEYAKLLNTVPDSLQNIKLYAFIDDWMDTKYLLGGETKDGIDCSSFSQLLYIEVYDKYIERTAHKQFESDYINKFRGKEFLEEGDLLFFHREGEQVISHVGVYLANNKFINATSYKGESGNSGVKICDITNPFWEKRYVAGGKRSDL